MVKIVTGISIAIISFLNFSDLKVWQRAFEFWIAFNNAIGFESPLELLIVGNLLFKLTGFMLAIIGLIEILKKTESLNLKLKMLFIYTVFAIILALPIYHKHPGIGGPENHGHSFWDGGLHFH